MVSERRNELIAELLHRVHFIEKWGRGIKLILSKEPDTEFSEVGTKFITTFRRKSYFEGKKTGLVPRTKLGEKLGERLGEKGAKSSAKSSVKILEAIKENKSISAKEIAKNIGLSLRAVEKQLAKLKQDGILKRIGPAKGGYWEVVKK